MPPLPPAISARVSSAPQAAAQTVASQVAAWRERVAADDRPRPEALQGRDAGDRGATLVRPARARGRDLGAAGAVDRLAGPAPARLARPDASHVRRGAALQRAGVAVGCVTRALGRGPEDARRLQGPGLMAAEERAKSIARHRRGTRPAAGAGVGHGLSGAPSGSRSGPQPAGGGQARDDITTRRGARRRRPSQSRWARGSQGWHGGAIVMPRGSSSSTSVSPGSPAAAHVLGTWRRRANNAPRTPRCRPSCR
jgi:Resolvase, N terminal domain